MHGETVKFSRLSSSIHVFFTAMMVHMKLETLAVNTTKQDVEYDLKCPKI